MTVITSGTWPIDPTTTSGTELAANLNELVNALQTTQASPSRPPAMQKGGVWVKTLGAADIALVFFDGTADHEIGIVRGGRFAVGPVLTINEPTSPTAYQTSQLGIEAGNFLIQTRDSAGSFVSNDYVIVKDATGAIGHQWRLGNVTKMFLNQTGVGIDALNPAYNLSVGADKFGLEYTAGKLSLKQENGSADAVAVESWGRVVISADTNSSTQGEIVFNTRGSPRARILSSGPFMFHTAEESPGVGNTSLGQSMRPEVACFSSDGVAIYANNNTADNDVMNIRYQGVGKGAIRVNASVVTFFTGSDYRLKENIAPVQGAGDIVKAMRPVTYTFKSDGSWHDGFLAHELQELHPSAVSGSKDAMKDEEYEVTPAVLDDDDNVVTEAVMGTRSVPDYQMVDYSKLTPILTAALQEALNKIDALEARIAALEGVN